MRLCSPVLLTLLCTGPIAADEPPSVLVSRQLLEQEHLAVGDVVQLSNEPSGAGSRSFRVAGTYEPVADPRRLGEPSLEARLHLDDLLALSAKSSSHAPLESVGAINVALVDPKDAGRFARDLQARMPGLIVRPAAPTAKEAEPFVVLERFHLAIAIVTVVASSMFLLALMVMLVDERRETVAVLRLIGLARARIAAQVLAEGLVIALLGAMAGVVLAVVLEGIFNRFFQWRYDTSLVFVRVTAAVAARSVLIAVPLGIAASLASSWGLLRRSVLALARR